jgi:DNA-binding NarL/FixJ family response regulator
METYDRTRIVNSRTQPLRAVPAPEPKNKPLSARPIDTLHQLSQRELAVLYLLTEGYSDRQISDTLEVTGFTVNKHVGAILAKMNVRSRTAAAVQAIRAHMFDEGAVPRIKAARGCASSTGRSSGKAPRGYRAAD